MLIIQDQFLLQVGHGFLIYASGEELEAKLDKLDDFKDSTAHVTFEIFFQVQVVPLAYVMVQHVLRHVIVVASKGSLQLLGHELILEPVSPNHILLFVERIERPRAASGLIIPSIAPTLIGIDIRHSRVLSYLLYFANLK